MDFQETFREADFLEIKSEKEKKMNVSDDEKLTVLAADDVPENLDIVKNALTPEYRVKAAVNGRLALKIAKNQEIDLILLDVRMPEMDGYEVCQRLLETPSTANIPIIFLTGQDTISDEVLGLEMGAVDFIKKPINPGILKRRIDTQLELRATRKKLRVHNNYLEELVEEKTKEISDSRMAMIYALAQLAEARDKETGDHLIRTQKYCWYLANKVKDTGRYNAEVDINYCKNLYIASPLHDIGKVGISDSILLKPGDLTDDEFERVKQHTVIGCKLLKKVQKMYSENYLLEIGLDLIHYHHEKWNGEGYPEGLEKDEIPLAARIMAIADVYDALRSERPYKEAFTHEKSCKIIEEDSGTHFDPFLVNCFLEISGEFKTISQKNEAELEDYGDIPVSIQF
ncbi:putative two-component system response regulator [Halarsenatibacter silvermanii]|uniref:Stage 0 sporulation protein A homolog n=2 Tax=Halarsenatibacter silvermanii TaxID=321763 RepID=A0A1G9IQZ6_9FIRM|nr:putative two-component system response regulator [Halarsenatibacter silvermanii]